MKKNENKRKFVYCCRQQLVWLLMAVCFLIHFAIKKCALCNDTCNYILSCILLLFSITLIGADEQKQQSEERHIDVFYVNWFTAGSYHFPSSVIPCFIFLFIKTFIWIKIDCEKKYVQNKAKQNKSNCWICQTKNLSVRKIFR